jgi:hypothetical protein
MYLLNALLNKPLTQLGEAFSIVGKLLIFADFLPFEQGYMKGILADVDAQWQIRFTHGIGCSWN